MTKHPTTAHAIPPLARAMAMAGLLALASTSALAQGTVAPFSNLQPSLALTTVIAPTGAFPAVGPGGSPPANGQTVGFVYTFAGDYNPGTTLAANGQTLAITAQRSLFEVLGTTYGGNGITTFALPDLAGRTAVGSGGGNGLGAALGAATVAPGAAQLPVSAGGGGQAFSNLGPSIVLNPLISVGGPFPLAAGSTTAAAAANLLGEVSYYAGDFVPVGYRAADGSLLPIAGNQALFSLLGTTYGGNGITTFALPDLTGRVIVGAGATDPLGAAFGAAATNITPANLAGAPVNNDQPSLALNYMIAVTGAFPDMGGGQGFDGPIATLGDVVAFAGDFIPAGYLPADGRLLTIAGNQALFSLLGTTYGGDGFTTFALPDLDGRDIVGAGDGYSLGDAFGADQVTLDYTPPSMTPPAGGVPEPAAWTLLIAGFGLVGATLRGRRVLAGSLVGHGQC